MEFSKNEVIMQSLLATAGCFGAPQCFTIVLVWFLLNLLVDSCRSTCFDEILMVEFADWSCQPLLEFVVAGFNWCSCATTRTLSEVFCPFGGPSSHAFVGLGFFPLTIF